MGRLARQLGELVPMTVRVIHGDCLEVLPTLPTEAVIVTDPVWPNVPAGTIPGSDDPIGIGIEIDADYHALAERRLAGDLPLYEARP